MSLERSIRKKESIEKKSWLSRKHANAYSRVREFEWHWHSFALVIFFYHPPPPLFFTTTWMTQLNAALAAIKRLVWSIYLILFSLTKSWSVHINYLGKDIVLVMTLVSFWVNLWASSVPLVFDTRLLMRFRD